MAARCWASPGRFVADSVGDSGDAPPSAVTEVAKVFGTKFELSGLGFDECLLMLIVCSMIGWVAAWLATVQHLRHFTPRLKNFLV